MSSSTQSKVIELKKKVTWGRGFQIFSHLLKLYYALVTKVRRLSLVFVMPWWVAGNVRPAKVWQYYCFDICLDTYLNLHILHLFPDHGILRNIVVSFSKKYLKTTLPRNLELSNFSIIRCFLEVSRCSAGCHCAQEKR